MTKPKGSVLNKADYDEIDRRISETMDEKISHLPTKDDFYSKMDEVLGEVQALREDFSAHKVQHERSDEDVEDLKKNTNHLYKTFQIDQPVVTAY